VVPADEKRVYIAYTQGDFLASALEFSHILWRLREMSDVNGCSIAVDRRKKGVYSPNAPTTADQPRLF
jgi:hypothetical protein